MTDTDTALADLICLDMHKFDQPDWRAQQQAMLAETGALVLSVFCKLMHLSACKMRQKQDYHMPISIRRPILSI